MTMPTAAEPTITTFVFTIRTHPPPASSSLRVLASPISAGPLYGFPPHGEVMKLRGVALVAFAFQPLTLRWWQRNHLHASDGAPRAQAAPSRPLTIFPMPTSIIRFDLTHPATVTASITSEGTTFSSFLPGRTKPSDSRGRWCTCFVSASPKLRRRRRFPKQAVSCDTRRVPTSRYRSRGSHRTRPSSTLHRRWAACRQQWRGSQS